MNTYRHCTETPPKSHKWRVYHPAYGYLVHPVDPWGKVKPAFTDWWEAAFVFSKKQAEEQCAFLSWHPNEMPGFKATISKRG